MMTSRSSIGRNKFICTALIEHKYDRTIDDYYTLSPDNFLPPTLTPGVSPRPPNVQTKTAYASSQCLRL